MILFWSPLLDKTLFWISYRNKRNNLFLWRKDLIVMQAITINSIRTMLDNIFSVKGQLFFWESFYVILIQFLCYCVWTAFLINLFYLFCLDQIVVFCKKRKNIHISAVSIEKNTFAAWKYKIWYILYDWKCWLVNFVVILIY